MDGVPADRYIVAVAYVDPIAACRCSAAKSGEKYLRDDFIRISLQDEDKRCLQVLARWILHGGNVGFLISRNELKSQSAPSAPAAVFHISSSETRETGGTKAGSRRNRAAL